MAEREGLRLAAFEQALARGDYTLDELVDTAAGWLEELAPRQSRYKVTERPDARTIRYYVTQNLLPRPVGYEGGRARYSGAHLLRLLVIKKLQAQHHTLQRIATVIARAEDEELLTHLFPKPRSRPAATRRVSAKRRVARPSEESASPVLFERRPLAHGASVDLPRSAIEEPTQREAIAEELEALARSLRNPPTRGES